MRLKPNPSDEKMRVWLTTDELKALYEYYDGRGDKQQRIALRLMGDCGLRSHEVLDVTPAHIRRMDTEEEMYKLRIPMGKGEKYRETVIPNDLRNQIEYYADYELSSDEEPVIDVTKRTLRNWVRKASESRLTDDEGWSNVTTHDLRRSWAGKLVESDVSPIVIMEMGGWNDYATFRDHYLNEVSDSTIATELAKV